MSGPYSRTLHSSVFSHSLLKISLYQEFCPLLECLFSYCYSSLISLLNLASVVIMFPRQQNLFILLLYYFLSSSVYFNSLLLSSAYLQYLSLFDKYFNPMFLHTLFSVFVIVCSVDLWLLAIVAWSSTHN